MQPQPLGGAVVLLYPYITSACGVSHNAFMPEMPNYFYTFLHEYDVKMQMCVHAVFKCSLAEWSSQVSSTLTMKILLLISLCVSSELFCCLTFYYWYIDFFKEAFVSQSFSIRFERPEFGVYS